MSLNKPVPENARYTEPNYVDLVRFLIQPFLESPSSLSVDCEKSHGNERVWIRVAFEGEDKGRVFGRGGRNIQAIRTVIQGVAQAANQFAHLDIYDGSAGGSSRRETASNSKAPPRKGPSRRPSKPRVNSKFRSE
ncbi:MULTISPECIES: KH domain-containing protein [unclassified Coleofasciculus]|uniref:KH domain-containing protein n=1 Tax=unclassified Coleofasciculus TaxID=2692782 RepID=UPI00187E7307|nr:MULTISPECIES: KH domain-containing protein [unclassified Coleofasciculus]MBE9128281.1 KH domain-containing protein [Coleofasciculus sp. LEGE 07081]MBE9151328.1 KH domain-containing protein [Coleofasciculus sp. LEGE 07092]